MAQSNFFQPGFDEQTETQNIDRQRQYAQLLRQKATEQSPQGSMVGGHYVAPSFTEGLAQLLNAYQGGQGVRQADERQKALAEAVRGRQTEEIGQFSKLLGGEVARDIQPLTQNDDEGNAMPVARKAAVPGDINAAYQYAASAKTPGLQQAGMQGQLQMAQEQAKQERAKAEQARMMAVLQAAPGPQQALAAGVPHEMVKNYYEARNLNRDKVQFKDVGGQLVPVTEYGDTPQGVKPMDKTGNPFSDLVVRGADGGIVPNAPLVGVKTGIARAGKPEVTVNSFGPKAFETELGKLDAEQLGKWRDNAQTANNTLATVQALRDADKQGAYSGGGANAKLAAANIINGFTGATPKGLVGSQLYNAEASKLVLDKVKTLGANPSNADREFIEKTVPQLATSAEARKQMANYLESQAGKAIDLYKRADTHARTNSGLKGFDIISSPASKVPASVLDEADAILRGK